MELGTQNMENIKVLVLDKSVKNEIISDPKESSLHLVRRSNLFTFKEPIRWLSNIPLLVMENISLYDKKNRNQILIQRYLSKVETFNSMQIDAPFVCSITIDRNKVNPREER